MVVSQGRGSASPPQGVRPLRLAEDNRAGVAVAASLRRRAVLPRAADVAPAGDPRPAAIDRDAHQLRGGAAELRLRPVAVRALAAAAGDVSPARGFDRGSITRLRPDRTKKNGCQGGPGRTGTGATPRQLSEASPGVRSPYLALGHGVFPFRRRRGLSGGAGSSSAGSSTPAANRSNGTPRASARRRAAGRPGKPRSPFQFRKLLAGTPARRASSARDRPAASRYRRSCSPKLIVLPVPG
jgi:hypothetical protein